MKKFTLALMAIVFALFVVSCGDSKKDEPTDPTVEPTDEPTTEPTDEPTNPDNPTNPDDDPTNDDDPTPPDTCKIDDSYASSNFDNYYTFKGAGTINDENADDVDFTTLTKTSLYLENQTEYNLKQAQSYILNATLTNGWKSVVLIGMGYGGANGYPNVQVQAIIPDQWFEVMDQLKEEDPEEYAHAPFAPMIQVASLDLHVKGQSVDWYKMCTVAINTYAPADIADGDMPEGSFQYCYGKAGTIDAGQTIKLGIDARLNNKFEDIQAAYNVDENGEPLEEGAEGYIATPADLCTCISFASGNGEYIDCPTDEPTEPTDEPTEEPTEPTEPTDEPTNPTDEPTNPTDEPTNPTDEPTNPTDEPTNPTDDPSDPSEPEPECESNADCEENEVCNEGVCEVE